MAVLLACVVVTRSRLRFKGAMMSQNGFGLVETFLMLALVTCMLATSWLWWRQYQLQSRLGQFQTHFAQLQLATKAYYLQQCRGQLFEQTPVTVEQLVTAGALSHASLVANPLGDAFAIQLSHGTADAPAYALFRTRLSKLSQAQQADYHQRLDAAGQGDEFEWRIPLMNLQALPHKLAERRSRIREPITSTQSIDSPLWASRAALLAYKQHNQRDSGLATGNCAL